MNIMRSKTIDDVVQYLHNCGLLMGADHEFDFARDNDAFKYVGYSDHNHKYLIGFEDDETPGNFYVSKVYVSLGSEGLLVADFGGCPEFEGTEEEVLEYIEKTCS